MNSLTTKPVMPEISITAMVPEPWGSPWQSRHFIASQLCKYFNVLWYTPTHEWRELLFGRRTFASSEYVSGRIFPGLHAYVAPFYLPKIYKPAFTSKTLESVRVKQIQRILAEMGSKKNILYLWRPGFESSIDEIEHDLTCYHIDDEYSWSTTEIPIPLDEKELIEKVDQVFIHSPAMMAKKGSLNRFTKMIPNGVQYEKYAELLPEPEIISSIPKPRVGYVGYIKSQLDFETLIALAKRHTDFSFIYVGPKGTLNGDTSLVDELLSMKNVYYLGMQRVHDLPAIVQHFDVCTMCYRVNGYTKFIYPLKIHEYLATGRPVIGSPISSLLNFEETITIAGNPDEWSDAMEQALKPENNTLDSIKARQEVARRHDWQQLVYTIARTLAERLGESTLEEFDTRTESIKKNLVIESGIL